MERISFYTSSYNYAGWMKKRTLKEDYKRIMSWVKKGHHIQTGIKSASTIEELIEIY